MKKRSIRERKEAFKKAYYAELQKQGIIDNEKAINDLNNKTKAELIEMANEKGIKANTKMTKAELIELIGE